MPVFSADNNRNHSLKVLNLRQPIHFYRYPAVVQNPPGHVRVMAKTAQNVQIDLGGKKYDMTKDTAGVWTCTSDPQVVGFHYYAVLIDGVAVMDRMRSLLWQQLGIVGY